MCKIWARILSSVLASYDNENGKKKQLDDTIVLSEMYRIEAIILVSREGG